MDNIHLVPSVWVVHEEEGEAMVLKDGTKSKAHTTKGSPAVPMALNFVLKVPGSRRGWRTLQLIGSLERSFHSLVRCSKNC